MAVLRMHTFCCFVVFGNLVVARRNILKAKSPDEQDKKEINHHRAKVLGAGGAYDTYQDYGEKESWDPWNLEDHDLEARLRKIVKRMDRNHNELISFDELMFWTFKALHSIDVKDTGPEDFQIADSDEDSFITWNEFFEHEYGSWSEDGEHVLKLDGSDMIDLEYNRHFNRVKSRFLISDVDNDGKLAREEFLTFKNPFKQETVAEKFTEATLKMVDSDGDGRISNHEYTYDWHQLPHNFEEVIKETANTLDVPKGSENHLVIVDFLRHEQQMFKNFFDLDGNGYLEGAEIMLWLSPENSEMAYDESMSLMKICDVNNDDHLDIKEIIDESDLWVDSDATEYGEQLRHIDEL